MPGASRRIAWAAGWMAWLESRRTVWLASRRTARLAVGWIVAAGSALAPGATAQFTKPYEIIDLTDDIFVVVWQDILSFPVEGNNLVIINDEDVVVVDSKRTPSLARTVIEEIRRRTDKPVRYLVNTHWHADHFYSNYVYQEEFPGVEIVGHPATRGGMVAVLEPWIARTRARAANGAEWLREGRDEDGAPLDEEGRRLLEARVERATTQLMPIFEQIRLTAPTLEVSTGLTLRRGSRTIEILHLGKANTPGDLVVYLPEEKIVATGDLLVRPYPFLGLDDHPAEWARTLSKLADLDVETLVLGHGLPQHDFDYLHRVQALFASLGEQVQAGIDRGWDLATIQENVDLEDAWRAVAPDEPDLAEAFTRAAVDLTYRELAGSG